MIKVYDSEDNVGYQCQNCDFTRQGKRSASIR
jgi:hypothetical protein